VTSVNPVGFGDSISGVSVLLSGIGVCSLIIRINLFVLRIGATSHAIFVNVINRSELFAPRRSTDYYSALQQ
jgi:hypothetical protein